MKLWEGRFAQPSAKSADDFNQSLSFDKKLYWHDIFASIAHVKMLGETKILPAEDADKICDTLQNILADIESGKLAIEGAEDIHTFIEEELVKRIGVNTQTKGKIALVVVSIIVCGLLGTLGGGNAVIAPVMLPIMASLGVTPTVVATLFKVAGEIGLILGPLTGVTLITMEVTGLSYGQLMIQAAVPFAIVWLAGAWIGANRAQKRTQGKEGYTLGEDVKHLDQVIITSQQKVTTIVFLLSFVALVGYGIATGQGTSYALVVMIVLAAVVAILGRIEIDRAVDCITQGVASQANMFLIFVSIEVLLNLVTLGGGFDALSNLLSGLAGNSATAVMLVASVVGGFGIEAAAVAEIQIIADMFGGLAVQMGLPMGCFAVSILAATRLTGSIYPTSNFAGQLGIAQCTNTKEALQAAWISVAFAWVFVILYAIVGPMILG